MDSKSLAKSKRAHTQHHNKKSHSIHKPKGQGGASEKNPEKLQGNQTKTPVQSRRISALPSNWDRYEDELDAAAEDSSIRQTTDVILPKSKGADYVHLISEAQAESHSKIDINSDCLSSLDDLLYDEFSSVVGSMISARGEGILSWMEDNNFIVEEDGSASYHEPGFLSLNLNALAKTLEQVDLHERLYIEPDLLPLPELCIAQAKVSHNEEPSHSCTTQGMDVVRTRLNESVQQESNGMNDPIVAHGQSLTVEAESLGQDKDIPILTTDESDKSSAIEADLDFLLDSFSKPHTQPSPVASASNPNNSLKNSSAFETELDSLLNCQSSSEPHIKPANPSDRKLHSTGFDDVLDDLLESTSVSIIPQQNQTSSSSSSVGKSKVLDEFDSWLDTI